MKKHRITAPATFGIGSRLELTVDQAASRKHALKKIEDDIYEVTAPVQFKAGEVVGYLDEAKSEVAPSLDNAPESPAVDAQIKQYRITSPITFGSGTRLELTADQAASRKHALKKIDGDIYETIAPVQFKAGEVVGYAEKLNKTQAETIMPVKLVSELVPELKESPESPDAAELPSVQESPESPDAAELMPADPADELKLKSIPELKAILNEANIRFKRNATQDELIALILEALKKEEAEN